VGNNSYIPRIDLGVLASFEAEEEVPGMLRIDAEGIYGSLGIGFGVGS
jgi:hypothetical protein